MNSFLIDFPLREQRLDRMLKEGIPYKLKFIKNNHKKNLVKIYKSNGKDRHKHMGN